MNYKIKLPKYGLSKRKSQFFNIKVDSRYLLLFWILTS